MSTSSVQQARDLVKRLAQEIEDLARSSVEPPEFFQKFLEKVVQAMQAQGGAVWLVDPNQQLQLLADVRLREIGFYEDPQSLHHNHQLVMQTLATGEAVALRPGENLEQPLPTEHLLVMSSLQQNSQCVGVVQIFQRPDASPEAHAGMLQYVEHVAGLASWYLTNRDRKNESLQSGAVQEEYNQFLYDLHRSLELKQVAATAANDGRRLLNCDRVTICVKRGKKVNVESISGQDKVNHRANLVRGLRKLSEVVIETREPFAFYGKANDLPPQLEKLLANYLQESESRMLLILPLIKPELLMRSEDELSGKEKKQDKLQPVLGCLIIEQINESEPQPEVKFYSELLEEHISTAIQNALEHKRIFLLPVWKACGETLEWFRGRKLAKTLAILSAVVAVGLSLALVPWDYRVEGEGRLLPVGKRNIFATANAKVKEVLVNGKENVEKGEVLVRLEDNALEKQLIEASSKLKELVIQRENLLAKFGKASSPRAERNSRSEDSVDVKGQLDVTKEELAGWNKQYQLLKKREEELILRAPITGTVATFQVKQLLQSRPVSMGESLLEVMDKSGAWQLELDVEEDRYGHLVRAQKASGEDLPVEFILATNPEVTFEGKINLVSTRANTSEEKGNVIQVHVEFDKEQLPMLRIGSEVRAKINCGKKSLGYVLFGDVVEFVQKYFWL